jgi:hypothetical protein
MFTTNDPTLMAMLVNVVFQHTREPRKLVEKIDQAFSQPLGLPARAAGVEDDLSVWKTLTQWMRIGSWAGKSRRLFLAKSLSGKTGSARFEASKRQALDRANAWSVPKTPRAHPQAASLGVERLRRPVPIEPLAACGEAQLSVERSASAAPEKAASSSVSEEHPCRELAGTRC